MEYRLTSNESNAGEGLAHYLRRNTCVQCGSLNLNIVFAVDQEVRAPEYTHTLIALCAECEKGQLERTYSDTADPEDAFEQTEWFLLDSGSMERLQRFIGQAKAEDLSHGRRRACPNPLSPNCACSVHWQLAEAAKLLQPLSGEGSRQHGEGVKSIFSVNEKGLPKFERHE